MFLYSSSESQDKSKKEITPLEIAGLVSLVVAAIGHQQLPRFQRWYFEYYEAVYLTLYGLICLAVIWGMWKITSRTRPLTARAQLLNEAGPQRDAILVGKTKDEEDLYLSEKDRTGHVQIAGATGRGKTESVIIPWLCRDILAGRSAVLMCGKGDPGILAPIIRAVHHSRHGTKVGIFDLGNPSRSCATNPLQFGSPQQITDRIMTAFTFDDSYYRNFQSDALGPVVQLIKEVPGRGIVTFKRIFEFLTDDLVLGEAIGKSSNEILKRKLTRHLAIPISARAEKLSGLLTQIAPFAIGEVAHLVNGLQSEKLEVWSISDVVRRESSIDETSPVLFIILIPTLKYQQIGHQLGKLLLQELGWAVGDRASAMGENAPFTPIYLDEFSAFVYDRFAEILNKARSSNVALHLSHQSLGDLGIVSPEFAQIVTTNTNVKCILGLNDPVSADFMARHMGTVTEEKLTERAEERGLFAGTQKTGQLSIREVEAYKVHPNLIKNFMNGRGVLHLPTRLGNITEEIQFARLTEKELYGRD